MKLYLLEELTNGLWYPVGIVDDIEYVIKWLLGSHLTRTYRNYTLNEVFIND